jgi:hypothetical protein
MKPHALKEAVATEVHHNAHAIPRTHSRSVLYYTHTHTDTDTDTDSQRTHAHAHAHAHAHTHHHNTNAIPGAQCAQVV